MRRWIGDLFFPRRCPICDCIRAMGDNAICPKCRLEIEVVKEPRCKRCGKPLLEEAVFCPECFGKESSLEYGYGLFVYNSSMMESISRFKYQGRKEYAKYYAACLYQEYGEWMKGVDAKVLIPVPIHKNRYKSRGYNQAELIAKELEKIAKLPTQNRWLIRVKDTLPQKELSDKERRGNLLQAFRVNKKGLELNQIPKCVILIDDIYTTGSTLEACAMALKEAGVQRVYFLCVCIGKR